MDDYRESELPRRFGNPIHKHENALGGHDNYKALKLSLRDLGGVVQENVVDALLDTSLEAIPDDLKYPLASRIVAGTTNGAYIPPGSKWFVDSLTGNDQEDSRPEMEDEFINILGSISSFLDEHNELRDKFTNTVSTKLGAIIRQKDDIDQRRELATFHEAVTNSFKMGTSSA